MYNPSRPSKILPTHASFSEFISSLLPAHQRDVQAIYHSPRYPGYNPLSTLFSDVVLSITPTPGVYAKLQDLSKSPSPVVRKPACFLHRPFNLDRRAVPRGTIVQACHKRFDELLTVGWNVALAQRLGLDLSTAVCVQGYKGDPDRRIGLVAKFLNNGSRSIGEMYTSIFGEFGEANIVPVTEDGPNLETQVRGIAIMNAFGPDEIARVIDSAIQMDMIALGEHAGLLYLTGEPKELGVAALKENYKGMAAVCVGHRSCEEWGIRFLGACIKQQWPDVDIHLVFEDEEPPPVKTRVVEPQTPANAPDQAQ